MAASMSSRGMFWIFSSNCRRSWAFRLLAVFSRVAASFHKGRGSLPEVFLLLDLIHFLPELY